MPSRSYGQGMTGEDEVRAELEEVSDDLLALREEIDRLEGERQKEEVKKVRALTEQAEHLYTEAGDACDGGEYSAARSKTRAARSMIEKAMAALEEE